MCLKSNLIFALILLANNTNFSNSVVYNVLKELNFQTETFDPETNYLTIFKTEKSVTVPASEIFVQDDISSFTFEAIFRLINDFEDKFVFLHLRSPSNSNLMIWFYILRGKICFQLQSDTKEKQVVRFNNPEARDYKWHKIILSYSNGALELYYDCKLQKISKGDDFYESIKNNQKSEYHISAMFIGDDDRLNDEFTEIDVKRMILYTGLQRPYEQDCEDVPNIEYFSKVPGPVGPPGLPGFCPN